MDRSALSAERCPNYLRNLSWPQPQVSTEEQRAPSRRLLTRPHLQHPHALPDSMIARQPLIYSLQSLGNRYTCTRPGLREPHKAKGKRKCIQTLAVISLDGRTWNECVVSHLSAFPELYDSKYGTHIPPHTHTPRVLSYFLLFLPTPLDPKFKKQKEANSKTKLYQMRNLSFRVPCSHGPLPRPWEPLSESVFFKKGPQIA